MGFAPARPPRRGPQTSGTRFFPCPHGQRMGKLTRPGFRLPGPALAPSPSPTSWAAAGELPTLSVSLSSRMRTVLPNRVAIIESHDA